MYDSRDLASLLAVITEGSFDAAAKTLHVTPGAMSQRIKQLEDKVGQLLVIRANPTRPTPAGEILLRLAQQVSLLSGETAQLLQRRRAGEAMSTAAAPPRLLTIAVNQDSLATWFRAALGDLARHADLLLDIRCDDASRTGKLLRDGTAVAAVLSAPEPIPGCTIRRLGILRYEAVASPDFRRRWFAGGLTAEALGKAPVVLYDRTDQLAAHFIRRHLKLRKLPTPPAHYIPSSHDSVAAIHAGLGWSMLPVGLAQPDLERGLLVRLTRKAHLDRPLYWQVWSLEADLIRNLSAAVIAAAKRGLLTSTK
jgi:LysR family transcriptional regulator (chromosome initiation inhibitor)